MNKYVRIIASDNAPNATKAGKILEVLIEAFEFSFILSR